MKRIVGSTGFVPLIVGSLAGVCVGILDASAGVTYLIGFALAAILMGIRLGPDRVELWRAEHSHGAEPASQAGAPRHRA